MQKCPTCGYTEGIAWPEILWAIAFVVAYFGSSYRVVLQAAFLIFITGSIWRGFREVRNKNEYEKHHTPVA